MTVGAHAHVRREGRAFAGGRTVDVSEKGFRSPSLLINTTDDVVDAQGESWPGLDQRSHTDGAHPPAGSEQQAAQPANYELFPTSVAKQSRLEHLGDSSLRCVYWDLSAAPAPHSLMQKPLLVLEYTRVLEYYHGRVQL